MGVKGAHKAFKVYFPEAIRANIDDKVVQVVIRDLMSKAYSSSGASFDPTKHSSAPAVLGFLEDDEQINHRKAQRTAFVYPTPNELARHICLDGLYDVGAKHIFFVTDHRLSNPYKARRQAERAIKSVKSNPPYPDEIVGFTDDHVLGPDGPIHGFKLEGARLMANKEHRKLFFQWLRKDWIDRQDWKDGANYYFSIQGFDDEPMHVIQKGEPSSLISFRDTKIFAEADYTCPEQLERLRSDGYKHFMVESVDSDLFFILLCQFWRYLCLPIDEGGIDIFLYRGVVYGTDSSDTAKEDGDGEDDGDDLASEAEEVKEANSGKFNPYLIKTNARVQKPPYIDMRAVARHLMQRGVDPVVFTVTNLMTRDSDYLQKWMWTPYLSELIPYAFMTSISEYVVRYVGEVNVNDFNHQDHLLHALLCCQAHIQTAKIKKKDLNCIFTAEALQIPAMVSLYHTAQQLLETFGKRTTPQWLSVASDVALLETKMSALYTGRERQAIQKKIDAVNKARLDLQKKKEKAEKDNVPFDEKKHAALIKKASEDLTSLKFVHSVTNAINPLQENADYKTITTRLTRQEVQSIKGVDLSPREMLVAFMNMIVNREVLKPEDLFDIIESTNFGRKRKGDTQSQLSCLKQLRNDTSN